MICKKRNTQLGHTDLNIEVLDLKAVILLRPFVGKCSFNQKSASSFASFCKVYQANKDQNTVVVNTLEYPIEARFIRLNPKQWFGHISLRMELYGCSLNSGLSLVLLILL